VDEALERREDPWNPARLRHEWVEQQLNDIQQKLAGILAVASAAPKRRSLSLAKRNIWQVLEAMPPEDLDSLQKEVLIGKVQDKIVAEYDGVGRARSLIQPMLKKFLQSRLSRRRQTT
jgi:hypothetical protein